MARFPKKSDTGKPFLSASALKGDKGESPYIIIPSSPIIVVKNVPSTGYDYTGSFVTLRVLKDSNEMTGWVFSLHEATSNVTYTIVDDLLTITGITANNGTISIKAVKDTTTIYQILHWVVVSDGSIEGLTDNAISVNRVYENEPFTYSGKKVEIISPYVTRDNIYKGQVHCHTTGSDGLDTPTELMTAYKNAGYHFVAITDHDVLTADPVVADILHIKGVEETGLIWNGTANIWGHIVSLNTTSNKTETHPQDILDAILADNAIPIMAHANLSGYSWTDAQLEAYNGYYAVEVYNAWDPGSENAEDKWDTLLTKNIRAFGTAVDDNHNVNDSRFNNGWIMVFADTITEATIVDAIRRGNFYASTGPTLAISVAERVITVDTDELSTITWIGSGGATLRSVANSITDIYTIVGNERYVRIKITRDSDSKNAWSNPIYVYQVPTPGLEKGGKSRGNIRLQGSIYMSPLSSAYPKTYYEETHNLPIFSWGYDGTGDSPNNRMVLKGEYHTWIDELMAFKQDGTGYLKGKIAIGTTQAPLETLQIGGSTSANLGIRINSATDTFVKFREGAGDYGFTIRYHGSDTNNLDFITHNNDPVGVRRMVINRDTGNIGMGGNIAPEEKLDITGNFQLSGYIKGDDIKSKTVAFVSGFAGAGYQLHKSGSNHNLTLDNVTVRKQLRAYELLIEQIRANRGAIVVSPGNAKVISVDSSRAYIDTGDDNRFPISLQADDLIRCQQWSGSGTKYYTAEVTGTGNVAGVYYFDFVIIDGIDTVEAGDEVVVFGNTTAAARQGLVYLTASDTNAPYMDVLDGVVDEDLSDKVKVRLGKLNGITDADLGGALSGYGLYSENAYLKGKIVATSGLIGGFTIDETEGIYAGDVATRVQMKKDAGFWAGATAIGDAPFSVTVAGVLKAASGTVGGWLLDTDAVYTGTKKTDDGYSTDGITIASNGSIHAKNFYINSDGSTSLIVGNVKEANDGYVICNEDGLSIGYDDYPDPLITLDQYNGIEIYKAHITTQPKLLKIGTAWATQRPIINFTDISDAGKWTILTDNYLGYSASEGDLSSTKIISWTTTGLSVVNSLASQSGRVKKIERITASTLLTAAHHLVMCNNTSDIEVDLPVTPVTGQEYVFKRIGTHGVTIDGNGKNIIRANDTVANFTISDNNSWVLVYDGTVWVVLAVAS